LKKLKAIKNFRNEEGNSLSVTLDEQEHLLLEANYFALASHLFWVKFNHKLVKIEFLKFF